MSGYGIEAVISAVDNITAPVRRINRELDRLLAPTRKIGRAFGEFGNEVGLAKVGQGIGAVKSAAGDLGNKLSGMLAPVTALGGLATAAGIGKAVLDFSNYGSEINDTAAKIGIGVEQLQELRHAADLAGVAQESLTGGISKLNKTVAEAAAGKNAEAADLFRHLGISLRGANGQIKSGAELMPQLADAFKKNENAALRTRMAMALFGKSGADMIPMLLDGSAGLASAAEEARALGLVLSAEDVAKADAFGDSLSRAGRGIKGFAYSLGADLVPSLQPLLDGFVDWIKANRELVASRIAEVVGRLARAIQSIDFNAVAAGFGRFFDMVGGAVDFVGGFENALIGAAIVMNGSLIASVLNLGLAIGQLSLAVLPAAIKALAGLVMSFNLSSLAIMATPIGWIVGGIAAVGAAGYLLWRNWDTVVGALAGLWEGMKNFAAQAFDGIVGILAAFSPVALIGPGIDGLMEYLSGISLFDAGARLLDTLLDGVKSLLPSLDGILSSVGLGSKAPALGGAAPSLAPAKSLVANAPGLGAPGASGAVDVRVKFDNAPAGMRTDTASSGDVDLSTDVGYSFAGAF